MNQNQAEDGGRDVWFYEDGGARKGGVSKAAMIELIGAGKLGYGAVVWRQGLNDWMPLENTELKSHLTGPPPLTGANVSNTLVWILAFTPVIGYVLEWTMAAAAHKNALEAAIAMKTNQYWQVTFLMNIMLCYFDEKRLKKAGVDTSRFKGWVWLVPVYILQRTKALKQKYSVFVVWLICIGLVLLD
jgi:hypothetical protein